MHIPYHDLAIIFKIAFDVRKDQVATSLIRNDHLIMWGITLKDIAAVAMQNTEQLFPIVFRPMDDIIKQITGEEIEVNDMMYVLTCLLYTSLENSYLRLRYEVIH